MVKPITHNAEKDLLDHLSKTLLFEGFVACYRNFSEQETQWGIMRQPIKLVRNGASDYDQFATAVFAGDKMIGYVPTTISEKIAKRLDAGEEVHAELVSVDPDAKDHEKVKFRVWHYNEEL